MNYQFKLHVGWLSFYAILFMIGVIGEMYAVGAGKGWSLTENVMALVERAPWMSVPLVLFLFWLFVHFALRLIPIALGLDPIRWI